jgi:hypothetical protein
LLHYSQRERIESDLREGHSLAQAEHRSVRHFAMLPQQSGRRVDQLTELALKRLGVRVIWYGAHDRIPILLGSVYAVLGDWDAIF